MSQDDLIRKISRGTTEIINVEGLEKKLKDSARNKKSLSIKAGFDPTAPDLHLGHVVLLKKLRQFQELGHTVFFLIGDFTAQIGDPSGKDQMRPKMNARQITQNAATYRKQVFKVLDEKKTKVVFNSRWLSKLKAQDILELAARSTVAQMLARNDFKNRFDQKKEISILEFIYPLLQGYDSVHLKSDVELGGSDQKFNLLMGRQLQESFKQDPQVVIMTPLLEGTDGVNKMSKSLGNYIGINEPAQEMFGKLMSISDELMYRYYELLTDFDLNIVKTLHPKEAKLKLAGKIVEDFHGATCAREAHRQFEETFSKGNVPDDISEYRLKPDGSETVADILVQAKLAASRNEVRRLLQQGAIHLDGVKITDEQSKPKQGILKVGKRRFLKLT
ncbi:MAG: tyrosine--tRNA ligase [Candidatus Omnitrophota bacterium]